MGMTMTQKILAAHAGLDEVKAGQLIMANLDLVLGNDVTSPVAINEFNKAGFTDVSIRIRSQWSWITLHLTRISNPLHSVRPAVILLQSMT